MENIGVAKEIEKNGRLYIPRKIVRKLDFPIKSKVFVDFEDDLIIIKKYKEKDKFSFARPLDLYGRISIPIDIIRRLNLDLKNKINYFEFFIEEEKLILKLINFKVN